MTNTDKHLARTIINGNVISTVKLYGSTYETMVFAADADGTVTDWHEKDCQQYRTASSALEGHQRMVDLWS